VSVLRQPAGNSNGNTFDYQGRQISCEHATRRVVRYEHNGTTTVLAEAFNGKPFNAPNDAVVHPNDGAIWFTDPGYGSLMDYEGNKGPLHLKEAVYRIDAGSGRIEKVTDEIYKPNGLCFSPDYRKLYVADTGSSHYPDAPKNIKVWDLIDGKQLANGREFASMQLGDQAGLADGIRADIDGNIWASAGWVGDGYDGVHIFAPDGTRIGQIRLPEICSNVCFGGIKRNRLFMTASQSVYAVYVETRGAHIT
jgi:gluconolactonase